MIEGLVLEEGHVELFRHKAGADVLGQLWIAGRRWQIARAAPLVSHRVLIIDPQGERGIVVEKKRGHVVVKDVDQRVGTLFLEPFADRLEAFKNRGPRGIVLLVGVVRKANGWRMGDGDAADNGCHNDFFRLQGDGARRNTH